tara:strand:- start:58630 stop:59451 length:822 start_codon:yes stop_codon:yes gene_type:complete
MNIENKKINYKIQRLIEFLRNPIKFIKKRRLVDVKLLPNPYAKHIDFDGLIQLHDNISLKAYLSSKEFITDQFISSSFNSEKTKELGDLFNKYGSDKESSHKYNYIYQPIISKLLEKSKNDIIILEVGIGSNNLDIQSNMGLHGKPGASARAFRDFDKRILFKAGDVDRRILFEEDRISSEYVNQLDINTLENFFVNTNYDLAIDDGMHLLRSNVNFLSVALKYSKKGSWIVIEDIGENTLSYWNTVIDQLSKKATCWLVKTEHAYLLIINLH